MRPGKIAWAYFLNVGFFMSSMDAYEVVLAIETIIKNKKNSRL